MCDSQRQTLNSTPFQSPLSYEHSISIFKKPFESRTCSESESSLLLLKSVPYIRLAFKGPTEYLKPVSKLFNYELIPKGHALCHHGDSIDKFWVIIHGEVRKYVPRPKDSRELKEKLRMGISDGRYSPPRSPSPERLTEESPTTTRAVTPKSLQMTRHNTKLFSKQPTIVPHPIKVDEKQVKSRILTPEEEEEMEIFRNLKMDEKYFTEDDELTFIAEENISVRTGDSTANMVKNLKKRYDSTLIAWTDLHVISAPIDEFLAEEEEYNRFVQDRVTFMRRLFPGEKKFLLATFVPYLQMKMLRIGENLFTEGSEGAEIYIVQKGEVELSKVSVNESKNYQDISFKPKISTRNHKTPIMIIPEGQLLGEEALLDYEKRMFTAKAKKSETIFYVIPRSLFYKLEDYKEKVLNIFLDKARQSLDGKIARLSANNDEAKVKQELLQEPTIQEKFEKQKIRDRLDLCARELLQGRLTRNSEGTLSHVSFHNKKPDDEEDTVISREKLEKLANMKTRVLRETTQTDPKYDGEDSFSPIDFQGKASLQKYYSHISKEASLERESPNELLSVWSEAMKGGWFQKRLQVFQRKRQFSMMKNAGSDRSPVEFDTKMWMKSVRYEKSDNLIDAVILNQHRTNTNKTMNQTVNRSINHSISQALFHGKHGKIDADLNESKFTGKYPVTGTSQNDITQDPLLRLPSEIGENPNKKQTEIVTFKIGGNGKSIHFREKLGKIVKGLGSPKQASKFVGKSWKLEPSEENKLNMINEKSEKDDDSIDGSGEKNTRSPKPHGIRKFMKRSMDIMTEKATLEHELFYNKEDINENGKSVEKKDKGKINGSKTKVSLPKLQEGLQMHRSEHNLFRPVIVKRKLLKPHIAQDLDKAFS